MYTTTTTANGQRRHYIVKDSRRKSRYVYYYRCKQVVNLFSYIIGLDGKEKNNISPKVNQFLVAT